MPHKFSNKNNTFFVIISFDEAYLAINMYFFYFTIIFITQIQYLKYPNTFIFTIRFAKNVFKTVV